MTGRSQGSGAVAVVTGGARGLGLGVAARLLRDGYRVAVLDLDEAMPAGALSQLIGDWRYFTADVSDREAIESVNQGIVDQWGAPSVLVNNAGIFPRGDSLNLPEHEWGRVLNVNLGGTFRCAQIFARAMLEGDGGSIVNTASGHAFRGMKQSAAYAASKGGIVALTRALAAEWAPKVRVNCVVPGIADTAMPRIIHTEESFQAAARAVPMGRAATPEDVAGAVAFLVSADAAYITGQTLGVNGGALML